MNKRRPQIRRVSFWDTGEAVCLILGAGGLLGSLIGAYLALA